MDNNDFASKFEAAVNALGDDLTDNEVEAALTKAVEDIGPPTKLPDHKAVSRNAIPTYTRYSVRGAEFNLAEHSYLSGMDLHHIRMQIYERIQNAPVIPLDEPLGIVYGFEYLALLWGIGLKPGLVIRLMAEILTKNCLEAMVSLSQGLLQIRGHVNGKSEVLSFDLEHAKERPSEFVINVLRLFKPSIARLGRY